MIVTSDQAILLAWAKAAMDEQMGVLSTCHICQKRNPTGYHATCWNCGQPVCEGCAVQHADGVFCPNCPTTTPF